MIKFLSTLLAFSKKRKEKFNDFSCNTKKSSHFKVVNFSITR